MDKDKVKVTFQPLGKRVSIPKGAMVRDAAARAGIVLDYPCGGQGGCGKCRVRVTENAPAPREMERAHLSVTDLGNGMRLACQATINDPAVIEIPETSLLASTYKILGGSGAVIVGVSDPPVRKWYVELSEPTLEDDAPDFVRLHNASGPHAMDLELMQDLPTRLRASDFRGTLVLAGNRLIDFEPGKTDSACYAAAFDVGTTTLVGALIDLRSGQECASTSRMNPQTSHGDDVVSRILYARQSREGRRHLQHMVVGAINEMIGELATQANIDRERIYAITFAGNTTMEHLLTGIDPSSLGEVPFVSAIGSGIECAASELGVRIHPRGRAYVFPVIGGFVGGDTIAGILATGLADRERPTMFIDIGTNGEIVLFHEGRLLATSCAAGPAFEGARISHGMRAAVGAIEEIHFDGGVHFETIGDAPPVGMCGSALIDLAAELLEAGIVVPQGLLLSPDMVSDNVSAAIRERVGRRDSGAEFTLVPASETQTGASIVLTQRDIRELQLATAAIRAGVSILLRNGGVGIEELDRVLVAGAFGNFIRCGNAQRIGLLPRELDRTRIQFVGNTSLEGARMAAASLRARERAEELRRRTLHIDLSRDPNFHMEFAEAMFFPEEGVRA